MLSRSRRLYAFLGALVLQAMAAVAWAAEGLDVPEPLERKVELEGLQGISLFFSQTYNENLLLYAIICTFLMAALGIAIAFVTDALLKLMGMEVEKIEHKE